MYNNIIMIIQTADIRIAEGKIAAAAAEAENLQTITFNKYVSILKSFCSTKPLLTLFKQITLLTFHLFPPFGF